MATFTLFKYEGHMDWNLLLAKTIVDLSVWLYLAFWFGWSSGRPYRTDFMAFQ